MADIELSDLAKAVDAVCELQLDAAVAGDTASADLLAMHGGRLGCLWNAFKLIMPYLDGAQTLQNCLKVMPQTDASRAIEWLHAGEWIDHDTYALLRRWPS